MDAIQTKTKILSWGIAGEKEKLDFDLCDFSPDQVGQLDRLIRADGDSKIRLTLEPEQKKLQIAAITADVGLVSLSCREGGQKLKIRGFKSPDERVTALKRMCAADTPILLTIKEIQGSLFGGQTKKAATEDTESTETAAGVGDEKYSNELITLKFKGLRGCKCLLEICQRPDGWRCGYALKLGNWTADDDVGDRDPQVTRNEALDAARRGIVVMLAEMPITGTTDTKRSLETRRDSMKDQIVAQIETLLIAGSEEDEVACGDDDRQDHEDFE